MKTLLRLSGVSLLIAAAAVVTLPAAAHGPNCIGIPNAPGPVVISGSGCYVLVGHLAGPGPLITISSGGAVELDLNGFGLNATPGSGPVIDINPSTAAITEGVRIHNGRISQGTAGVTNSADLTEIVLEDLEITDVGLGPAIDLHNVGNVIIRRNLIVRSQSGISVSAGGTFPEFNGTVRDNVIQDCGGGILLTGASGVEVADNRLQDMIDPLGGTTGHGIFAQSSSALMIARNTIHAAAIDGIRLESSFDCDVDHNVVSKSANDGIAMIFVNSSQARRNTIGSSGGSGIHLRGSWNVIRGNQMNQNTFGGLWIEGPGGSTLNTYGGNITRTGGAAPGGCGFNPPGCVAPSLCDDGTGSLSEGDNVFGVAGPC